MSHEIHGKIFPRRATGFRAFPRGGGGNPVSLGQGGKLPSEGRPVLSPQARLALLTNAMDSQPYNHRLRPWNPSDSNFPIQPVYGAPRNPGGGIDFDPWKPDFPIQPVYGAPRDPGGGIDFDPKPWKPDFPIQPVYGAPRKPEGGIDFDPKPWKPDFPIQPVYGAPRNPEGGIDFGPKPWKPDFPIQPVYGAPRTGY